MTTMVTTHGYHGYHITMTTVVLGSEGYFDDLGVTQGINPSPLRVLMKLLDLNVNLSPTDYTS